MAKIFRTVGLQMRYIADQCYELVPLDHCVYCGDEWEVYDHVPPVAAYNKNGSWSFKYPACRDCNSILGAMPIKDIRIRRYYILKRIFSRYKSLMRMPNWENVEIDELQGMVKSFVKKSVAKKYNVIKRIEFLTDNYITPQQDTLITNNSKPSRVIKFKY